LRVAAAIAARNAERSAAILVSSASAEGDSIV
jgi:hypothetical protein